MGLWGRRDSNIHGKGMVHLANAPVMPFLGASIKKLDGNGVQVAMVVLEHELCTGCALVFGLASANDGIRLGAVWVDSARALSPNVLLFREDSWTTVCEIVSMRYSDCVCSSASLGASAWFAVCALMIGVPRSIAAEHAGNVFVAGDEVSVRSPRNGRRGERLISMERKYAGNRAYAKGGAGEIANRLFRSVGEGWAWQSHGRCRGEKRSDGRHADCADTGISWFYADLQQIRDACTLCRLAGVKWIRDRLSWPEMEPERGKFAEETRYEKAMRLEHEAGLKILQVNHASPPWAAKVGSHFPDDLRDVYDFYHGLAKRWNGLADAIEPWNEPDIELFGGHTGCEIASFQKAAYLGLKAGDPKVPVCEAVFAIDRPETLESSARTRSIRTLIFMICIITLDWTRIRRMGGIGR